MYKSRGSWVLFCLGNVGGDIVLPESPDGWQSAEVEAGGPAGVITSNRPEGIFVTSLYQHGSREVKEISLQAPKTYIKIYLFSQ